jgi:hypothetical protein
MREIVEKCILAVAPENTKKDKPNPGKPFPNIKYDSFGFGGRLGLGDMNDN